MPRRLGRAWDEHGGSWRAGALAVTLFAVFATSADYVLVADFRRAELDRVGYNPVPWFLTWWAVAAASWLGLVGFSSLLGRFRKSAKARRGATALFLLLGPAHLISSVLFWLLK